MPSKTALLRERTWRTCKGSSPNDVDALIFFCETFAKIQHPERGAILFALRPAQKEILEVWLTERYSIVLKARQIGWSTLAAVYALWLTFFWPDQLVIMLSKGEREAEKLLAKATYAYDRLPAWMREKGPKRTSRNLKKLSFANASGIESMPSKEDPGRSSTASLVFVDEWAFLENAEEAWASIEPIADIGGRVIGLSTANGSGDFFESFWSRAVAGVTEFRPMFYAWWANDDRDDAWYETKKRTMLEWQLHQEYPSTPEEAFIKSGHPVFDVDALAEIETLPPHRIGSFDLVESTPRRAQFIDHPNGVISIWFEPNTWHSYVIGADVAEGLEHGDYSSAYVIDVTDMRVVASIHGHIDTEDYALMLAALGYMYDTCLLGVEVNNHGLTVCKALLRLKYPKIYFRHDIDKRTKERRSTVGWYTSSASKPVMIDELGHALKNELLVEDAAAIGELRTYKRDEKGRTNGSPFDDRVMALAVAMQMVAHASKPSLDEEHEQGTYNWHAQQLRDALEPERSTLIGRHNVRDTLHRM